MTGPNGSAGWQTCIFSVLDVCAFVQGDGVDGTESSVGNAATPQSGLRCSVVRQPE